MDKYFCVKVGILQTNCYIIESDQKNAVVIDPGDRAQDILNVLSTHGLTAKKIVITHGHNDHIGALYDLVQKTGAEVYIHKADASMISDTDKNLTSALHIKNYRAISEYNTVTDKDTIDLDNIHLTVMHTPGHTEGSMILLSDGAIYTGDTLFKGQCGRTDLPGGSYEQMLDSLKKISEINGEYIVLPGHDEQSTLSAEKANNPYINLARSRN